jgi:peptide/nickel transport system permease protein
MTGQQETSQASPSPSPHVQTPFDRFWREFAESRLALLGLAVLIIVMVIALAAPLLAPQNPYDWRSSMYSTANLHPANNLWVARPIC